MAKSEGLSETFELTVLNSELDSELLGTVLPKRDVNITANPGLSKNISRLKFKFPKTT
jgi:hypothetical protein